MDIEIGFERGAKFACGVCGKMCNVHDSTVHRIRHLDWFAYCSYLNVKVPKTKCAAHGVKVISQLPRGHKGSHLSFFEERIMRLAIEMSMNAVATEFRGIRQHIMAFI